MSDLQDLRLALREREVEPLGEHAIAQIMKDGGRLRRRRRLITGATVAGSALSLALVAGFITLTVGGGRDTFVTVPAATAATTPPPTPSSTSTTAPARLVTYLGKRPVQFDLRKIPRGWVLQGSGTGTLTLAPKNATDKSPYTFVGKLVVMVDTLPMETGDPEGSTAAPDQPARGRLTVDADGMQTFTYAFSRQRRVLITVPAELGWGREEIATFAKGVTVHQDVQLSLG